MSNHHQLQLFTLNGQPISSNALNRSQQRLTTVQRSRNCLQQQQQRLKKQRWYAGFQCRGNAQYVQNMLELIARKVQEFNLSHYVPLVRVEKMDQRRGSREFYLFIAIESERPGEFPQDLLVLPYFSRPIAGAKYFAYEQIKPMVGQAHRVDEYTNPIPIVNPPPDLQQTNPFVPSEASGSNLNSLSRFLDLLSAQGYGSWAKFQIICQSLGVENPGQVIRNLKLLGHLETSANGKKWSIAPTALVPLNHESENLEFYLCGQQNDSLRQQLKQIAEVKSEGQPALFGLPRWKVIFSDRSTYDQLDKLVGIPIHKPGNIAQRLADCLPTPQEWQANLRPVGSIVTSQRFWRQYTPETKDFQDCGLPEKTGFYEMRREVDQRYADRTFFFYEADTQTWRLGDWYGLRFLALYHSHVLQDCRYRSGQKQLEICYNQRWPQLYERALVLASGYLPQVSSDRLFYHNIAPKLAYTLTQKLSIHCQGL